MLERIYFPLERTARYWLESHEAFLTSWLVASLTFTSQHRRERAEGILRTRTKVPNESITSFVEDVFRLIARADPQATEEKKLRHLMTGVKSEIFGGLIRNPPTTVGEFVPKVTNMERALLAHADTTKDTLA